ncbi:CACTA en-spm transposon protein [Cucumis melo var. makuwa]|uniref:CACTA en-spm transposon protein n=1 Tax=Cucumis melo var. makuwa TaxID=1194695 RepID=A0A5A7UID5_CUCMM|nr:CACTA en-spm transposon protein [Cucumis melo var. makuwa]
MFLEFGEDLNTAGRSSLMGDNSETTQPFSTPRRRRQSRLLELERYVHANGGLMLEENASRSSRAIYRSKRLISIARVYNDNKALVEFYAFFFLVKDLQSKRILLWGTLEDGLHKLQSTNRFTSSCSSLWAVVFWSTVNHLSWVGVVNIHQLLF